MGNCVPARRRSPSLALIPPTRSPLSSGNQEEKITYTNSPSSLARSVDQRGAKVRQRPPRSRGGRDDTDVVAKVRSDDGHATVAVEGTAADAEILSVYVLALDTRLIWGAFVASQVALLSRSCFGLGSGESSFFALKGFASSAGSPFRRFSLSNTLIDYKLCRSFDRHSVYTILRNGWLSISVARRAAV